jgi:segregation and condensation protein B
MTSIGLVQIIEGALLAAGKPLSVAQLGDLFEQHERPDTTEIRAALKELGEQCEGRGIELQEVASGFRFQVRQALSPWVARLWHERPQKYSRALLETLALIAYRQPITRGEIEEIRGVAVSSNIIKTLHEREWIRVVGHRDVPGRPAMYATTRQFLDYFNLKNLDQLPALAEIRDLETLTAELGFAVPVAGEEGGEEAAAGAAGATQDSAEHDSGDTRLGLTVVGGTDHQRSSDPFEEAAVAQSPVAGQPAAHDEQETAAPAPTGDGRQPQP